MPGGGQGASPSLWWCEDAECLTSVECFTTEAARDAHTQAAHAAVDVLLARQVTLTSTCGKDASGKPHGDDARRPASQPQGQGSQTGVWRTEQRRTPVRTNTSDMPPEILGLIFSHVDTATLLSAVPHVCRDWRTACAHDVYGPKVRLKLYSVGKVLRIRPECMGLWVAAVVGRFAWVCQLDMSGCDEVADTGLQHVAQLTQLATLVLPRGCVRITDTGLECVAHLTQLTTLVLRGCGKITGTGLQHVAQRMQLTTLVLGGCRNFTDTGLEHVARLTQLTTLVLGGCSKITDTGLGHVARLTQLTTLVVHSCYKITDTGLQHVAKLAQLTSLNLYGCDNITDTGLKHVAQLTLLTSLNLKYCRKITDTGAAARCPTRAAHQLELVWL